MTERLSGFYTAHATNSSSAAGGGATALSSSSSSSPFSTASLETAFNPGKINFTSQEKLLFLDMIAVYKETVESKLYDNVQLERKDRAWRDMADTFNARSRTACPRTPKQLKALWKNMKAKARLDAKRRGGFGGTGGGGVTSESCAAAALDDVTMGQISRRVISILLSVNEDNTLLDDVLGTTAAAGGADAAGQPFSSDDITAMMFTDEQQVGFE